MTKRDWFRLHSFTGVITGLLLFVICWSGTWAVVSSELDWLVTPEMRVAPGPDRVSWGSIAQAAQEAVPQARIGSLFAPLNDHAAATVSMVQPGGGTHTVLVDPYRGEVTGLLEGRYTVQRFFRSFHMQLFLPEVGLYLVTAFAITLIISLIAALYFYKRWWTRFFRFKSGRGRVFWSELHKTAGLWSIWFIAVIALTGGWYLYEAIQPGPNNYVGPPPGGKIEAPVPQSDPALPALPLDKIVTLAESAWPALQIGSVGYGWYSADASTVYLEGQASFPLVRDRANQMHLDPRTGEVLWKNGAEDMPLYWLWSNMADPLHFGNFAGLWSKLIWFAFGLVLCGLILTGTYLHAQRLVREAGGRSRHRWPGTSAALVVSLLVLVVSVPFGVWEAREYYGPTVEGIKQWPSLAPGVKAVIAAWSLSTLGIIAGWVWMLWRPGRSRR